MRQLIDFLPILLFFGAYKAYNIYVATGVIMVATLVQMAILYKMDGTLQTMHKVTLALVLGFVYLSNGCRCKGLEIKIFNFTGPILAQLLH